VGDSAVTGREGWFALAVYLARREVARRYAGSVAGPAWAIAFPALQIALYWAVFTFGLKVDTGAGLPLAVLLVAGMTPWFFFSEALSGMAASISSNTSLVKRVVLPVELLPLSRLIAAAIVHGVVLALAVAALWVLGFAPGPHLIVLLYAGPCVALLALSLGALLALANVAFSDVAQAIGAVLLLWFWATPILWQADRLPAGWRWVASANPLTHPVEAYRYALLGPQAGPLDPAAAICFWCATSVLCLAAWLSLRRFKRELADLL
jgi:teichoic acid transport system permease protein